jgi:hypothetical protein
MVVLSSLSWRIDGTPFIFSVPYGKNLFPKNSNFGLLEKVLLIILSLII